MPFKINALIIGSQKSGTSSLLRYLVSHPNIVSHQADEFPFFADQYIYTKGLAQAINNASFTKFERNKSRHILCKSASVLHTYQSFQRIYDHNPKIKLVCVLRNPIERAFSAFWYAKRCGYEKRESFYQAIQNCSPSNYSNDFQKRNCSYLIAGKYYEHLNKLLEYFNKDQINIILFEDLTNTPNVVCEKYFSDNNLSQFNVNSTKVYNSKKLSRFPTLTRFLLGRNSIKKYLKHIIPLTKRQKLKIQKKLIKLNEMEINTPVMDAKAKDFLIDYYSLHNRELSKFLGRDLSNWNS